MSDQPVDDAPQVEAAEAAPHVDAMIDALREDGEVDSLGEFTVNRERARERLRDFQLNDPSWYLLLLIQAAVRQGAERIEVDIDVSRIYVGFDGRPFTHMGLETMYDELFSEKPRDEVDGRHELALGINAALAMKPSAIQVCSGDGKRGVQLDLAPGDKEKIEERELKEPGTTIEIELTHAGSDLLERSMSEAHGSHTEEVMLRERCQYATQSVVLRQESEWLPLSGGLALDDAEGVVPLEGDGIAGAVGFQKDVNARPELRIVKDGVWITSHYSEAALPGLVAVGSADGLRKDLSQFDVIQDEVYEELQQAVKRSTDVALDRMCDRVEQLNAARELLPRWLKAALMRTVLRLWEAKAFDKSDEDLDPQADRLARTPIWAVRSNAMYEGGILSLNELKGRVKASPRLGTKHLQISRTLEEGVARATSKKAGSRGESPAIDPDFEQDKMPTAFGLGWFFAALILIAVLIAGIVVGC